MKTRRLTGLLLLAALAGCETPTTQRYAISPDNNQAIRALSASPIFGEFGAPASFSATCRGLGAMQVADGLSHAEYIRKAFADEFQMAGAPAARPGALITGRVTKLEFSTLVGKSSGSWEIGLTLTSSNGKSMATSAYYQFSGGFLATEACRNTAEAFSRAVQNLIFNTVKNPAFQGLLS